MEKVTGQGFNKEKLIFLGAALAMGLSGYAFITSKPLLLGGAFPVSAKKSPKDVHVVELKLYENVLRYLTPTKKATETRKSPFTIQRWKGQKTLPVKPVVAVQPTPIKTIIPPPPKVDKKEEDTESKPPMKPSEKDLAVTFMGVVRLGDNRYALLGRKDGKPPVRLRIGDTIDDLGYKITGIEKQAILLEDVDKNPYVLKDNRFSTSGASDQGSTSGIGSMLPGGIPSFQQAPEIIKKIKNKLKKTRSKTSNKKSRDVIRQERRNKKKEGSQ